MNDTLVKTAAHAAADEASATKGLLRFLTCGSVDDGKSTLIGRLLYDTKSIFEDQLEHVEETSKRRGDGYTNLEDAFGRAIGSDEGLLA